MSPKIKSFEAACKALKLTPAKVLPIVNGMPKQHQEAVVAYAKLVIIAEALNEGWKPNWKDDDQPKYYPWFNLSSGSGLAFSVFVNSYSYSHVGSRLCFKSRELAEYAGNKFIGLYKKCFLLK